MPGGIPLGNGRFRLALDRGAEPPAKRSAASYRTFHPGDANYHFSVHPAAVHIAVNLAGKPQTVSFAEIPDQPVTAKMVRLHAAADSGLPVRFYVKAGPAVVQGDELVFTPIPVRSRMPITITVVAWQWGNSTVRTAPCIERTFKLGK